MSQSLPDDHLPDDRLPNILSEFEQQLRETPTSAGPTVQRRDRLMYDSGYAVALSQFEVQLQDQTKTTRRSVSMWKNLALALSVLLVASVGLQAYRWPPAPSPLAAVSKLQTELAPQNAKPSLPQIWPGTSPVLAESTKEPVDQLRATSVRSHWTDQVSDPQPTPTTNEASPAISIDPPLRATDYRRLLDRT
ncbi:MAG: hypothetical protein Q8M16_17745 [Pirellulaceae bacterium]|nr:hypothetical protein [Pirellulaceae bacterium]